MIKLVGINKIYRTNEIETVALEDVNLTVNKGEFLSIMGPSGCGKSTLLNIMGLLDTPTGGSIEVAGTRIESMKDKELAAFRNKKLGFVFQSFHLLPRLTALDNVALPLLYGGVKKAERRERARAALEMVGLGDRIDHRPDQLSGGPCQRVAIARAMVGGPKLLLADEPTGALDSASGAQVMELFRQLHENGATIIMITHDAQVAQQAQRIMTIRDGVLSGGDNHEQ